MRSTPKMLLSLISFLSFLASGCSHPTAIPLNVTWEFVERPGLPLKACLSEEDVGKLKAALDRGCHTLNTK